MDFEILELGNREIESCIKPLRGNTLILYGGIGKLCRKKMYFHD
jgi:hypothetical protein